MAARALVLAAAALGAVGGATAGQGATPASVCSAAKVGVLVPLTGPAAKVGREQRDFARLAALRHNERSKLKVTLVERDTHLVPADASAHAVRLASDPTVLAVVGPAESDEVESAGATLSKRGIPFVSPSARRASLTDGSLPTFFRVIPHDGMQAPTLASFMTKTLAAKRVVVTDDGSAYGVPLADAIEKKVAAAGMTVTRLTVDPELADFAVAIATVKNNVDAVVLAWQQPDRAQVFGDQLRAVNKRTAVVGTDALDAAAFKLEGSYVSAPLPDVRAFEHNADLLTRYRKRYGQFSTALGPPAFAAAQAAILAVRNACRDGRATRAEVRRWLRRTYVPDSILGTTIAFTDRGDVRGARFSLFHIEGGTKRLVQ